MVEKVSQLERRECVAAELSAFFEELSRPDTPGVEGPKYRGPEGNRRGSTVSSDVSKAHGARKGGAHARSHG